MQTSYRGRDPLVCQIVCMKGHTLTRLSDVFTTKWGGRSSYFEWAGRDRQHAALHGWCTVLLTSLRSFSRNGTQLILSNGNNYILFLLCTVFESESGPQFPLTRAAKTNLLSTLFHITTLSVHEMSFSSVATSKLGGESQWERGGSREDNIEVFGVMRVRQLPSAYPRGNRSERRNPMFSFLIKDVNYMLMSERDNK